MKNMKVDNRIKVLEVLVGASGLYGGVEQFVFENIKRFDERMDVDILFGNIKAKESQQTADIYDKFRVFELKTYNGKIFGALNTYKQLDEYLKKNNYDIIHVNTGSITFEMICMLGAKKNNISVRIAHSHSGKTDYSLLKKIYFKITRKIVWHYSTDRLACSQSAAMKLFGRVDGVEIIKNAVDISAYEFNIEKRNELRKKEGIGDNTLVLISVGNLQKIKNYKFMLEIISIIHKKRTDCKLWIIGDGDEKNELKKTIKDLNIEHYVTLWGTRNNVGELLQAADIYICTSFSEGLSMSIVEAQAAGLKVVASDSISKEHSVTNLINYLSLNEKSSYWADSILSLYDSGDVRCAHSQELIEEHYDIDYSSRWLQTFYINKIKRKEENA